MIAVITNSTERIVRVHLDTEPGKFIEIETITIRELADPSKKVIRVSREELYRILDSVESWSPPIKLEANASS